MPLTKDSCKASLKEGMRAVPGVGSNVDEAAVDANFKGLGSGVFAIFQDARTRSDSTADPTFWAWVSAVNAWLGKLHDWERGVNAAIDGWAPATPSEVALRNGLKNVARPPAPPAAAPTELKGTIV